MEAILKEGLAQLGLDTGSIPALTEFSRRLLEKNQVMNLTAITEPADVARLHLLDCACLLTAADFRGKQVVDVGTGAGFPGMPLRLLEPDFDLTLLDSLGKRIDFLQETGVEAIHAHEMALLRRFVAGVKKIPGVALYGDFDHERTAVAALNIGDMDSGEVSDILSEDYGIATRPGAHCAPRLHKALGTEEQGAVRFSFGWYNTEEEADAAVNALREIAT